MSTNKKLITTSILITITFIMSLTPLGYFKSFGIDISFMMIPVSITSITMGQNYGVIIGFVFGLTSFIRAFGISSLSTILFNINPFFTFILCFVPRILAAYICGIIFKITKNCVLASAVATLLNTVLYTSTLLILFGNTNYIRSLTNGQNLFLFALSFVGINSIIELVVNTILSTVISKSLLKIF